MMTHPSVFVMFRGTFIASHTLENLCKFQVLNVFPATSGWGQWGAIGSGQDFFLHGQHRASCPDGPHACATKRSCTSAEILRKEQ